MKEAMWPKVNPLPGAETLIQRLISYNIPIAVCAPPVPFTRSFGFGVVLTKYDS